MDINELRKKYIKIIIIEFTIFIIFLYNQSYLLAFIFFIIINVTLEIFKTKRILIKEKIEKENYENLKNIKEILNNDTIKKTNL